MSSMEAKTMFSKQRLRKLGIAMLVLPCLAASVSCHANDANKDGEAWDRARAQLSSGNRGPIAQAIDRWRMLTGTERFTFGDYAAFVLAHPSFPDEETLRRRAEDALSRENPQARSLVSFFDRAPPLTNPGRAQYALALGNIGRPEATAAARAAWRGGAMSDATEAAILAQWSASFTQDDQDARMNALLWAGAFEQAARQLPRVSLERRGIEAARLATLTGGDPYSAAAGTPNAVLTSDPGFLYSRARALRKQGNGAAAQALLAARPLLARLPLDRAKWVNELLAQARGAAASGNARGAVQIAAGIDDAFSTGEDISQLDFDLRDDYTSLMWLGGMQALSSLGDPGQAAGLFYRYGAAARTPGTRSKGFYWAGLAATRAGKAADARAQFEGAARYADQFYGQLALERLNRPLPQFQADSGTVPTAQERAQFDRAPLTMAVREVARDADWKTTVRFFREICEQQQSEGQHNLVAELARNLGRRDLGVIVGQAAAARGYLDFQHIAFPLIPVPQGYDQGWTMIHAITRQESQFAENAISHAGARGLMQLMPATANEQAGKLGLSYSTSALIADPQYNIQVGGAYFQGLMRYFGGSRPLAVAAYNAGAGNVNKWLRANGDPRQGGVSWIDWIERIPLRETRNYVQRVLENAVVYEAMNPEKAAYKGPNPLSYFLGKSTPG